MRIAALVYLVVGALVLAAVLFTIARNVLRRELRRRDEGIGFDVILRDRKR